MTILDSPPLPSSSTVRESPPSPSDQIMPPSFLLPPELNITPIYPGEVYTLSQITGTVLMRIMSSGTDVELEDLMGSFVQHPFDESQSQGGHKSFLHSS
jgi:hypothetical protein